MAEWVADWYTEAEAHAATGISRSTWVTRRRAGQCWSRIGPAKTWQVWVDAEQVKRSPRGSRGPACIGPAPEGAAPVPTRDPATGDLRAPVHEPPPQIAREVPRLRPGAALDYDPEKDRLRVKIPGRVGVNLDGQRVAAVLSMLDLDAMAGGLERLAQTYAVPKRPEVPATRDDSYQVHVALRDLHAGDGDAATRTAGLESAMWATCEDAVRYCGEIDEIVLPCGSDLLTIDTYGRTTTKGTQLFPDLSPEQIADLAVRWMVMCVDIARQHAARVRVVREPGNHDRLTSYHCALALAAWYRATPDVDVVLSHEARTYFRHGRQLVCYDHSDLIRDIGRYPATVAAQEREAWGATDHAHVFVGHRHNLEVRAKDLSGVTVYQARGMGWWRITRRGAVSAPHTSADRTAAAASHARSRTRRRAPSTASAELRTSSRAVARTPPAP